MKGTRPVVMRTLRESTTDLHVRVERAVDLSTNFASHGAYRDLIRRLYGLYIPLERALQEWDAPEARLDLEARRKSPLLETDLRAAGATASDMATIARCPHLPLIQTTAKGIGCLYVLEGATLGGEVIARHLETQLGLTVSNGGAFFASYGARVRAMWAAFGEAAERYCDTASKRDQAVNGAVETFACFERWIARSDSSVRQIPTNT